MINPDQTPLDLPLELKTIIGTQKIWYPITKGGSDTQIYTIIDPLHEENGLYLKLSSIKNDRDLVAEAEKLKWLREKLPVPKVLFSAEINTIQYLLLTEIKGIPSFDKIFQNNRFFLVKLLAKVSR